MFKYIAKSLQLFLGAFLFLCALSSMASGGSYLLNVGDRISISVYGETDLTFDGIRVGDSGLISYPFLGELNVKGKTLKQIENLLIQGLKPDYLVDPKISVAIVEYRPFFMNGEIQKPGSYQFQPGISLHQAVSLAGGLTERASRSKIFVVHDGESESVKIDLSYELKPGDTITIKQSFF